MNKICQPINPLIPTEFIGKIKIPSTLDLQSGNIIIADTFDNSIFGNFEVFTPTIANENNLNSKFFALIINDGVETLDDGRRPSGQPNYYTYNYKGDDIVPIIFLGEHMRFNISLDVIDTSSLSLAVVGNYLVPTANSVKLNAVEKIPDGVGIALKILAARNTPIGGEFGGQFAYSLICEAEEIETGSAPTPTPAKWEYPVQDGNTLTITQAYNATQDGNTLTIE